MFQVVREQFEVAGFRVSGRVVDGRAGPVVGARVFLDGRHVVTTSADGRFNLENVKTATYRLTAQAGESASSLFSFIFLSE